MKNVNIGSWVTGALVALALISWPGRTHARPGSVLLLSPHAEGRSPAAIEAVRSGLGAMAARKQERWTVTVSASACADSSCALQLAARAKADLVIRSELLRADDGAELQLTVAGVSGEELAHAKVALDPPTVAELRSGAAFLRSAPKASDAIGAIVGLRATEPDVWLAGAIETAVRQGAQAVRGKPFRSVYANAVDLQDYMTDSVRGRYERCADEACAVEIGDALNLDRVFLLTRAKEGLGLTLRVLNPQPRGGKAKLAGGNYDLEFTGWKEEIARAVAELIDRIPPPGPGPLPIPERNTCEQALAAARAALVNKPESGGDTSVVTTTRAEDDGTHPLRSISLLIVGAGVAGATAGTVMYESAENPHSARGSAGETTAVTGVGIAVVGGVLYLIDTLFL